MSILNLLLVEFIWEEKFVLEDVFIVRFKEVIEVNMYCSFFVVLELCWEMGVSRFLFY